MNPFLFVAGFVVIAVVMYDVFVTTLAVGSSAGPITGRIVNVLWQLLIRTNRSGVLSPAGVVLTIVILVLWLLGVWAGWALIFNADASAVVTSTTERSASAWERIYYTGYTLFTLGNGEYKPNGTLWQLLTVMALLNGLSLATLGITYLVPVTTAAVERRQLAASIASLGASPDDILVNAWEDGSFGELSSHLNRMGPSLSLLSQRHLAYPVLHFFHSSERGTAAGPTIARLDETVTLLRNAVADDAVMAKSTTGPLHGSLTQFLDTLRSAYIDPAEDEPPRPGLHRLRAAGIPVVDDATFAKRLSRLEERRQLLLGLVINDAWAWSDVWQPPGESDTDRERPKTDDDEDGDDGAEQSGD